ncbi:Dolichyl-diphosphooligosaccharide--protein glycosyltransferase subunit STT3A, partial [Clarias magur]
MSPEQRQKVIENRNRGRKSSGGFKRSRKNNCVVGAVMTAFKNLDLSREDKDPPKQ